MNITALIHTRNEEANLPDCLASVAWADEVVVADMQSTDQTRKLAEEAGARVIEVPLAPVVEPVRNQAIAACRGDWVLIVDADERVPDGLRQALVELTSSTRAAAIALPRKNYFAGVWLEHAFWPDYQVRLVRPGRVNWPETVHDHPAIDGTTLEMPADPAAALEHPGYGNQPVAFLNKLIRYAPMDAQRLREGLAPPLWPYLIRRPLGEFHARYLGGAWRHGLTGLIWSLMMTLYQLLIVVHYWEQTVFSASNTQPAPPGPGRGQVRWEMTRQGLKWLFRPRHRSKKN